MTQSHSFKPWAAIQRVNPWYLLVLFLISSGICILALRTNNQNMIKLRNTVYSTDQKNGDVEAALQNLRSYVYAHMNTNLSSRNTAVYPPIQLKYTYDRLEQAEQQRVATVNATVYTQAQAYCQQQNPVSFSGRTRVPCIEAYVQQNGAKAQAIPPALYEFDFVSPNWSPDLAGWSLITSTQLLILYVGMAIHRHIIKNKDSNKSRRHLKTLSVK